MSPAERVTDPDLLSRWLALAGLIASADEMLSRRGGAWTSLALVAADTACESVLGFIANSGSTPLGDREQWEQIYQLAMRALRDDGRDLPQSLRARVNRSHRLRNLALHVGSEPNAREAETAVRTARDLMEFASHGSAELELVTTAGPLEAVGRLVAMSSITEPLIAAGAALREEKYLEAADQAAIALENALTRVTPRLRPDQRFRARTNFRDIDEPLEALSSRASLLEAWVLALGTGLRPAELAELQRVLGRAILFADNHWGVHRDPGVDLSPSTVTRAAMQTADLIFRLWHTDSLRPHRWETLAEAGTVGGT